MNLHAMLALDEGSIAVRTRREMGAAFRAG